MMFRNLIFQPEVVKQRLPAGMVSHHEQQASKWNGEQQHRVLWPAYNPNIAPPQASTEGLFQHQRLISPVGRGTTLSIDLLISLRATRSRMRVCVECRARFRASTP